MSHPMMNTNAQPAAPTERVRRRERQQQREILRDQSNMAGVSRGWYVSGNQPEMVDGSNSPPRLMSEHYGFWPNNRGSVNDRQSPSSSWGPGNHPPETGLEFRQWPEQSQYQPKSNARQRPVPCVVHDNRTYIGNDWQCTNGNAPRISQTISSCYMVPPLLGAPMPYNYGPQEYQEYPDDQTYSVIPPPNQGVPRFQPSQRSRRAHSRDSDPPPYQQPSNRSRHRAQTPTGKVRGWEAYNKYESSMFGETYTVNPSHRRSAYASYASPMRAEYGPVDAQGAPAPIPSHLTVYNEPTSREHFNMLLTKLRSFSVAKEHGPEWASDISPLIAPSGKQLFEKAKAEDKTGKYDNCYWDERMDCFVNRGAGNVGACWKKRGQKG